MTETMVSLKPILESAICGASNLKTMDKCGLFKGKERESGSKVGVTGNNLNILCVMSPWYCQPFASTEPMNMSFQYLLSPVNLRRATVFSSEISMPNSTNRSRR